MNNEQRKSREDRDPRIAARRKAKQAAYSAKKYLKQQNDLLEIEKTTQEESVSQMNSTSLMNWYKTLIEEENRFIKLK